MTEVNPKYQAIKLAKQVSKEIGLMWWHWYLFGFFSGLLIGLGFLVGMLISIWL